MGCLKLLNLNAATPTSTTEMPLDNGIMVNSPSAGGVWIFGVRGPYVFKINPTTGVLNSFAKVSDHELDGPTCIAFNPNIDRLLIAGWNKKFPGITDNEAGPYGFNTYIDLFTVDPSTLFVDVVLNLTTNLGLPVGQTGTQTGVVSMKWMGTGALEGLWGIFRADNYSALFRYVGGTVFTRKYSDKACFGNILNDIAWDGITNLYWANSQTQEISLEDMSENVANWNEVDFYNLWPSGSSIPFGVEVAPSTGDIYAGTQLGTVKRLSYAAGFSLISTCNTGVAGTIYKVRYNPYDGLLYCPIYGQDAIAVINPGSNGLVAVHAGYDSPWDLLFSATKTWVVQGGNLGIKEFV